jgi:hypothetical protein
MDFFDELNLPFAPPPRRPTDPCFQRPDERHSRVGRTSPPRSWAAVRQSEARSGTALPPSHRAGPRILRRSSTASALRRTLDESRPGAGRLAHCWQDVLRSARVASQAARRKRRAPEWVPWFGRNGEGGIRTLGAGFPTHSLSRRAPSTTQPPLQVCSRLGLPAEGEGFEPPRSLRP